MNISFLGIPFESNIKLLLNLYFHSEVHISAEENMNTIKYNNYCFFQKTGKDEIFKKKFQGIFSDQKICKDCPHRYEREEAFFALNLTVKNATLQDSLDQFVKGELLEGDNAYYCEKCGEKVRKLS